MVQQVRLEGYEFSSLTTFVMALFYRQTLIHSSALPVGPLLYLVEPASVSQGNPLKIIKHLKTVKHLKPVKYLHDCQRAQDKLFYLTTTVFEMQTF